MSASLCLMEERKKALRGHNMHVEEVGVPAVPVNSNVKRCLFGAPDPKEIQRKYEEMHRKLAREKKEKWQFDFEKERPVDTDDCSEMRLVWQQVGPKVPEATNMPQLGSSSDQPIHLDETVADYPSSSGDGERSPSSPQPSSSDFRETKQTLITDFMRQKRHAGVQGGSSGTKRLYSPSTPAEAVAVSSSSSSTATAAGGSNDPEVSGR